MIVEFEDLPEKMSEPYDFNYISNNDGIYEPVDDPSVRLVRFKAEKRFLFFRESSDWVSGTIGSIPKKHYWHDQLFTKVNTKIIVR